MYLVIYRNIVIVLTGVKTLTKEQARIVGGTNHSHATADLFYAIEKGDAPEWEFSIQTMDPLVENKLGFDPLDPTKIWPAEEFPLIPVGRLVLDTNIDNFHAEAE